MKNVEKLMKKAQEMQQQFVEAQKSLEVMDFVGESGAGAVSLVIKGNYRVASVKVNLEKAGADPELWADLFVAAYNNAHDALMAEAAKMVANMSPMSLPSV